MTSTVKISALAAGSAPGGTEAFPAVQGTSTVKLTLNQVKTFVGAGTGTVTSVALSAPAEFTVSGSPVTHAGALAFAKAGQSPNQVWAGPLTGAAAAPAFRALDPRDLPPGAVFVLSIPIANVGATGDAGSVAVPSGLGDFTIASGNANAAAMMRAWSNGAAGAVTGTVRSAASGGGSALYTFTTVTPPGSGALSRSTASTNTVLFNASTTTTLYFNISATTASGTGTVDVVLQKLP